MNSSALFLNIFHHTPLVWSFIFNWFCFCLGSHFTNFLRRLSHNRQDAVCWNARWLENYKAPSVNSFVWLLSWLLVRHEAPKILSAASLASIWSGTKTCCIWPAMRLRFIAFLSFYIFHLDAWSFPITHVATWFSSSSENIWMVKI